MGANISTTDGCEKQCCQGGQCEIEEKVTTEISGGATYAETQEGCCSECFEPKRCVAITKKCQQCKNMAKEGKDKCGVHLKNRSPTSPKPKTRKVKDSCDGEMLKKKTGSKLSAKQLSALCKGRKKDCANIKRGDYGPQSPSPQKSNLSAKQLSALREGRKKRCEMEDPSEKKLKKLLKLSSPRKRKNPCAQKKKNPCDTACATECCPKPKNTSCCPKSHSSCSSSDTDDESDPIYVGKKPLGYSTPPRFEGRYDSGVLNQKALGYTTPSKFDGQLALGYEDLESDEESEPLGYSTPSGFQAALEYEDEPKPELKPLIMPPAAEEEVIAETRLAITDGSPASAKERVEATTQKIIYMHPELQNRLLKLQRDEINKSTSPAKAKDLNNVVKSVLPGKKLSIMSSTKKSMEDAADKRAMRDLENIMKHRDVKEEIPVGQLKIMVPDHESLKNEKLKIVFSKLLDLNKTDKLSYEYLQSSLVQKRVYNRKSDDEEREKVRKAFEEIYKHDDSDVIKRNSFPSMNPKFIGNPDLRSVYVNLHRLNRREPLSYGYVKHCFKHKKIMPAKRVRPETKYNAPAPFKGKLQALPVPEYKQEQKSETATPFDEPVTNNVYEAQDMEEDMELSGDEFSEDEGEGTLFGFLWP